MQAPSSSDGRLHTWKEIAAYVGASVRAVQMWERDAGLPVQRPPGAHGHVAADPEALRLWLAGRERPSPWWRRHWVRMAVWGIVPLMLLALLAHDLTEHHRLFRRIEPAGLLVEGRFLSALDDQRHEIWRCEFDEPFLERAYSGAGPGNSQRWVIEDLDGDSRREVIFVEVPAAPGSSHRLHMIDTKGRIVWSYPAQTQEHLELVTVLRTIPTGQSHRAILVHFCGLPDHRGTFLVLSPDGRVQARYEHGGHIDQIATAGEIILLGGECARSDAAEVHKLSLVAADGSYTLRSEAEVLFPRSCVNRLLGRANRVSGLSFLADGVLVTISEFTDEIQYEVYHELNRDLMPRRCWASDAFRTLHRRLEIEGALTHPWTPAEIAGLCRVASHASLPQFGGGLLAPPTPRFDLSR